MLNSGFLNLEKVLEKTAHCGKIITLFDTVKNSRVSE